MASLNMNGPYPFTSDSINKHVTKTSTGNYALGKMTNEDKFRPKYVGRSDDDVNKRLHDWIDKKDHPKFKFSYASSVKAAFEKECHNWHDFKPDENTNHPARPDNTNWKCPVCDTFG